jgi:hypothetical protein
MLNETKNASKFLLINWHFHYFYVGYKFSIALQNIIPGIYKHWKNPSEQI